MMKFGKTHFTGIMVLAVLLCFWGQSAAFTTQNTTLVRSFDKLEDVAGGSIRVTVSFSNLETASLRGFYYSDHIPAGLTLTTESVSVNGSPVRDYTYESGIEGDVWIGSVSHRWILETPSGFLKNNPAPPGGSVQIVYVLTSARSGRFELKEFNWAGYYQGVSNAAFGHSEMKDQQSIIFHATIPPFEIPEPVYNDKQKAEIIFTWLESLFPEILSPVDQPTQEIDGIYYRSYSDTNVLIGTYMEDLYYLDNSAELHNLGMVDMWLEHVPNEIISLTFKTKEKAEIIFNRLESLFPEILSPVARPTQETGDIYYRHYTHANVFLLITYWGDLYYFDDLGGLHFLGTMDEWLEYF